MALAPGDRFGSYEILALLGVGGMGEVYCARDTVLHREVALKVLPDANRPDPERLARFDREARLLASLNHPNIATLHGLETGGVSRALVMELVEGETLADRLARAGRGRGLPLVETLDLSLQIAAALDAAHERGIIHRDLKPSNIKIRPDGTVKVLDFGIAKVFEPGESETRGTPVATITHIGNTIVGTPCYMSPEQARGLPVDKRADVWAFGCVLYEMLTGERAFDGEQPSDTMARVIERSADLSILPAATPVGIRRLLQRCLTKDPRQRLRDMGDARLEIADVQASADESPHGRVRGKRRPLLPWIAVAVLGSACALLAVMLFSNSMRSESRFVARFPVVVPSGQVIQAGAYTSVAIAPAGTHIAYITTDGIYLRATRDSIPERVDGTDGQDALGLLFSPDGEWIAFYSDRYREIRKVRLAGGTPIRVAAADGYLGGSWGEDDRIVFAQARGIFAVPGGGGTPTLLAAADAGRGELIQNPVTLPAGRGVIFTLGSSAADSETPARKSIVVQPAGSTERRVLIEDGADARYLATGHLVYRNAGALLVVPFDIDSMTTTGTPVPVVTNVAGQPVHDSADFAVSRNGSLVYRTGATPLRSLVWLDRNGQREDVGLPVGAYFYARVSPDGTKIAASMVDDGEVYVWDVAGKTSTRLTFNTSLDFQPIWTPDSKRILFGSAADGRRTIASKAADGNGATERLFVATTEFGNANPNSLSPGGTHPLFRRITPEIHNDLWLLSLDDARVATPLLVTEHDELNGEISPDGRWFAYQSDESGSFEIYIRPFPQTDDGRWQVSNDGGVQPAWSPDGCTLYYLSSGRLVSVPIEGSTAPSVGRPRFISPPLTYTPFTGSGRTFDVSPDGERFLMLDTPSSVSNDPFAGLSRFEVVLHWTDELQSTP